MKPPSSYVFSTSVDLSRHFGEFSDRVFGEFEVDSLCFKKSLVLLNELVLRLREDALKVIDG